MLPLEIYNTIFDYLNQRSQINILLICKLFYLNLYFKKFKISKKVIDINSYHFNKLIKLDISYNTHITNLNHLSNLKKIIAHNTNINQEGINKLRLVEEIYISNNKKIINLNHLSKLREITAIDTNLTQEGINESRLINKIN